MLFVLLVSLRGIASFYTDYLWFSSLDLSSLWRDILAAKVTLTLVGGAIFFVLCWGNLVVADRIAPQFRPLVADDDLIERYLEMVGRRAGLIRAALVGLLAVLFGLSLGGRWNEWILFANRVDFGETDATFNTDIGFYVFELPFLTSVLSWAFSAVILVLLVTILGHIVNGGIVFQTQGERTTPQVKAHLSVLLGVLALIQAGRYWLGRYSLTFSTRGTVDGASYTDYNVDLRVTYLLVVIALFAFGLFIANIWRRGWVLPMMAVGLWVFVAALAGGLVPAFVQRFRVEPSESSMERTYIQQNIAATRAAYGLNVEEKDFVWQGDLDADDLADNVETLRNVRLWHPTIMEASFQRDQKIRSFYAINDVDVDRYTIDGRMTQVLIAARDLTVDGVRQSSWEATHLTYTHGHGVVAATANDRTPSGDPSLIARDVPMRTTGALPEPDQPGLYFGEGIGGYVVTNTEREEIAYQGEGNTTETTRYGGADGVELGSGLQGFMRRTAFALRFGQFNMMISGNITPESRVLLQRDIRTRVEAIAPFLAYDHDPYVVVLPDGRIRYILDAYVTSAHYPNAERADTGGLDERSGLFGRSFSYARNSVKAVIDAYDGTVDLYVVDEEEPILSAYRKAFPDLFTDLSEAPEGLEDHFRYPEDLFTVQTQMWAKYHVSDPDTFYNGNDEWSVPREPGLTTVRDAQTTERLGPDGQPISSDDLYTSQYLLMQLPGEEAASFVLLRPYVTATQGASSQNQLSGFIVARNDPGEYGQLESFVLPTSVLPDGPNLAADGIQSDDTVAELRRSLCQGASVCEMPAPSLIPIGNSIMYVQPLFVAGTELGAPRLEKVIVSYQSATRTQIEVDDTFRGALEKIFGDGVPEGIADTELAPGVGADPDPEPDPNGEGEGEPVPGETPGETTEPTAPTQPTQPTVPEGRVEELIGLASSAFTDAEAAARQGDQVTYARKIDEAKGYVRELDELTGAAEPSGTGDDEPVTDSGSIPTTTTGT